MTRVSAVDLAWFQMEAAKDTADIIALFTLDGVLDEPAIRALLETRLLSQPRFRAHVAATARGGRFEWREDEAPTLDGHFARELLRAPGGPVELLEVVNRLVNEPLDLSRSPWRFVLIDGAPEGSLLFVQLHHYLGDGFALVETLRSLADETAAAPGASARRVGAWTRWTAATTLARRAPRALSDLVYLLRLPFDPPNALRGRLVGHRRVEFSAALDLARVKALAHARRATVNDVLLAAVSGGLQRYLAERAPLPKTIRALMPVNLRRSAPGPDQTSANWFGLVYVPLPLADSDRESRLARVKATIEHIKSSEEAAVSLGVLAVLGRAPRVLEQLADRILARKASLVVSNVPGPQQSLHLAGRRVRDIVFWVPHPSGLACGISLLSYAGRVRIGVRADVGAVGDPERIVRQIERELLDWDPRVLASDRDTDERENPTGPPPG